MLRRLKKLKDDMAYCRLERMLREMADRGYETVTTDNLFGVVCDDGIILLNFESKGWGVCMIKKHILLPDFKLKLTEEQMQEYNGGKGVRERVYPYRKDKEFREATPCKK